jgi:hypothetical protein
MCNVSLKVAAVSVHRRPEFGSRCDSIAHDLEASHAAVSCPLVGFVRDSPVEVHDDKFSGRPGSSVVGNLREDHLFPATGKKMSESDLLYGLRRLSDPGVGSVWTR